MKDSIPVPHAKTEKAAKAELAIAYAHCEEVTKHHSKSFYLATSFLPREKRRAIRAFYAFCRTTDDIVDLPRTAFLNLEEWRHAARKPPAAQTNPVLLAWADAKQRYDVPQQYAEELIDGCELDLRVSRYKNFDQLRHYCYLVASTVGLISMHIIGSTDENGFDERTTQSSIELGIALQLTNILRDVGEDWHAAASICRRTRWPILATPSATCASKRTPSNLRASCSFKSSRTDKLYQDNFFGIAKLKQDGRMAVGSAILLYRGILGKIAQNSYNVFTKRAHLSTAEKLSRLPGIYAQVRGLSHVVS